jgi:UDP-N-acetylglucosamine 4-epimerase
LLQLGQHVVGIDNFATGHRHNIEDVRAAVGAEAAARLHFIEGDICDGDVCRTACEGVDLVLHQAAIGSVPRSIDDPLTSHRANVDGFLEIALAARDAGVERFVYASSSSVYGDEPALPKIESRIGSPLSPYAATKRIDEIYAGVLQACYDLPMIGLRYFNVFGRRQDPNGPYAAVIPRWINRLLAGDPCIIFGDGSNSRDFCYVDNAVQANILSATAAVDNTGTVYNVGNGDRTDLVQLFGMIRDALAKTHPEIAEAKAEYADPRPGDVPHSQASIEHLSGRLGYVPSHDVRSGMVETVAWYLRSAS